MGPNGEMRQVARRTPTNGAKTTWMPMRLSACSRRPRRAGMVSEITLYSYLCTGTALVMPFCRCRHTDGVRNELGASEEYRTKFALPREKLAAIPDSGCTS
jgi:hypothetical protein